MKLNYLLLHIRNIFVVVFLSLCWMIKGIWAFIFHPIYSYVKQEAMAGKCYVHNHPGVLIIVNMNGNILQRYFTHRNFYGCQ